MSYAIVLSALAEKEIDSSFNWYEDRLQGLGNRFLDNIEKAFRQISLHPEFYPCKKEKFREILVEDFPYLVIYELLKRKKVVLVLHIFNTNRNPGQKYKK